MRDLKHVFEETLGEFYYPHTRLEYTDEKDSCYYTKNRVVYVNPERMFNDETFARHIFRHETCHIWHNPVNTKGYREMMLAALQEVRLNEKMAYTVANMTSDYIVDSLNIERLNDQVAHGNKVLLENYVKEKGPMDEFQKLHFGVYNFITGVKKVKDKRILPYSKKIYDIASGNMPPEYKTREIAKIVRNFIEDELKQSLSSQALANSLAAAGVKAPSLKDQMDGKLEEAVSEMEFKDQSDFAGFGQALGVELKPYLFYRSMARRKIQFSVKTLRPSGGRQERTGYRPWTIEDDSDRLDVAATLEDSGVLLPNVNTLQEQFRRGTEIIGEGIPQILMVLDSSGSMPQETALVTIYSLIESARVNGIPVGIVVFSDDVVYSSKKIGYAYDAMEEDIHDTYASGGTRMVPALKEAERILAKEKQTLVMMISDFQLGDPADSKKMIDNLKPKHKTCILHIAYGKEDMLKEYGNHKVIEVPDLGALDSRVVEEYNTMVST
ncbi:MAG: VWA domain-containing protein [Candidatus Altiarchaeota archaeon]|nr:VWA domain-containing protein [Candidatus Altiarchaeota archaeon]